MAAPQRYAVTEQIVLFCDVRSCDATWASEVYEVGTFGSDTRWRRTSEAAAPAFAAGWRVYAGAQAQHTYCPQHGPTVPMRLVHGTEQ